MQMTKNNFQPLVSIVTPAFNCERYIRETVDSVLAQSYSNWEIWIVDDCSTDRTPDILNQIKVESAERGDARIHIHRNERNSGAAHSRNWALRHARGEWIAFLDGDDVWLPNKLERQLRYMAKHQIDFSFTDYELIDTESQSQRIKVTGPKKITKRGFFRYCWVGCLTVMYRVETIGVIQIPDLKKRNDYAIWLRACKKSDCYRIPEVLAYYRKGQAGSLSSGSFTGLVKYHYQLFRISEGQPRWRAVLSTARNLLWGPYKKLRYVRKY